MAKIISLKKYVEKKFLSLSSPMIKTLSEAYDKQMKYEAFGQADLKGSFIVLFKRGYIDCREITVKDREEILWYVTKDGITALKQLRC